MTLVRLGLVVWLAVPAASAQAQWYADGYIGAAATSESTVRLREAGGQELAFTPVRWEGHSFEPPLYYGLRVGRELDGFPRLALEAEFIHAKAYADGSAATADAPDGTAVRMTEVVQDFAMSHGLNLLVANVVVLQTLGNPSSPLERLRIAARVGVGICIPHVESTVRGVHREEHQLAGTALHLAAGLDWRLSRHVGVLAEYKFTRAAPDVDVSGGQVLTTAHSHHGVFGARVGF